MKKLVITILMSLPCYPMQNLIEETQEQDILSQESITICNRLPGDLSRKLAQEVLKLHPIVPHLLRNIAAISNLALKGHKNRLTSATFNKAGDRIVTASGDNTAKIWDAETGECLLTLARHKDGVFSAVFNEAEDRIVTVSDDGTAKIWDVKTGESLVILANAFIMSSAVFNKTEDRIVTASLDTIIWNTATGERLLTLEGQEGSFTSATFNKAGDRILTTSDDRTAKIWDAETGECLLTLVGHKESLTSATFNKAGDRILTASWDKTAKIWDVKTDKRLTTLAGHKNRLISAIFNKAGDRILTASWDKTAKIWNLNDFHECEQFLFSTISLTEAIILNAIYEAMVARRLVTLHGENAFTKDEEPKGLLAPAFWLWRIVTGSHVAIKNITLDFNSYPHLQEHYDDIPKLLRKVLDHFVTKRTT